MITQGRVDKVSTEMRHIMMIRGECHGGGGLRDPTREKERESECETSRVFHSLLVGRANLSGGGLGDASLLEEYHLVSGLTFRSYSIPQSKVTTVN